MEPQLRLFTTAPPAAAPRGGRLSRGERAAIRIDRIAWEAEAEAERCRLLGDRMGERRAHERARDARRSAELLRAGPQGVAKVLAA